MKKNRKLIISIIFLVCIVCIICTIIILNNIKDKKNIELIKEELPKVLDKKLETLYESKDSKDYGISNINYEITSIYKQKNQGSGIIQYTVSIVISCDANENLSDVEKSLVAYEIEHIADDIGGVDDYYKISNGSRVSIRHTETHEEQITSIVNGEVIHKAMSEKEFSDFLRKAKEKKKKRKNNSIQCETMAKEAVLNKLKVPSTAKFGTPNVNVTNNSCIVTGYVDAENSFGAKLRNNYKVSININGGQLTITSVDIN